MFQQLFATGKSQKNAYMMQAAHDSANIIRLKYEDKVYRTTFVDYYTGTPAQNRGTFLYSASMYKELLSGNARSISLADDPVFMAAGFIGGPGEVKIMYSISEEAVKGVMKQWGKTTGKKALNAFTKSAEKGFVSKQGSNGIKNISGFKKGGKFYDLELKVKNAQFDNFRIYGYQDKTGKFIFDYFGDALH
jgi:hypothetical protein